MEHARSLCCPSAQPGMPGAVVHGVVDAASGRVAYLQTPQPVTPELLAMTAPLQPTEVLRFSAACAGDSCRHYTGSCCSLVQRLVQIVPAPEAFTLPACSVRRTCRWFVEQGKAACLRCSEIVTDGYDRDPLLAAASQPPEHPSGAVASHATASG